MNRLVTGCAHEPEEGLSIRNSIGALGGRSRRAARALLVVLASVGLLFGSGHSRIAQFFAGQLAHKRMHPETPGFGPIQQAVIL